MNALVTFLDVRGPVMFAILALSVLLYSRCSSRSISEVLIARISMSGISRIRTVPGRR